MAKAVATSYYQLKDYPKTIQAAGNYVKNDPNDTDMLVLIAQSQYLQKNYKGTTEGVQATIKAARATLNRVEIGGITVYDVQAVVLPDEALAQSLLGMSFLSKLRRYEYANGRLIQSIHAQEARLTAAEGADGKPLLRVALTEARMESRPNLEANRNAPVSFAMAKSTSFEFPAGAVFRDGVATRKLRWLTLDELLAAIEHAHADEVVVLPSDKDTRAAAEAASANVTRGRATNRPLRA